MENLAKILDYDPDKTFGSATKLAITNTVAFSGVDVVSIQVQVSITKGLPNFIICGLPDKAVNESKNRIRSAFSALGISLPAQRIVVNMSPANLQKEGSHYDLPIALALLQAMDVIPHDCLIDTISMGELGLNSSLIKVPGILLASIHAYSMRYRLICPEACGSEAACGGEVQIIAPANIGQLIQHLRGVQVCAQPTPKFNKAPVCSLDFSEVVGHQTAKRALEIAVAGGHHLLMVGSPGVGKSMLAMRVPSIMPQLSAKDILEVSMIHSVSGLIDDGLITVGQFRDPHHNTSVAAMLGGGKDCKPGEISLAHKGILFLDEITLWNPAILNGLRESLETGCISIARANAHIKYPAQYQLIGAMNPCPCGKAFEKNVKCTKLPQCMENYINKIPGPILDRFGMTIYIHNVNAWDKKEEKGESSTMIKHRILKARKVQKARSQACSNQNISSTQDDVLRVTESGQNVLQKLAAKRMWSNRQYYNARRIARTIADLEGSEETTDQHIMEAVGYVSNPSLFTNGV